MGEGLRKLRIAVWGEAPDTPEERKVSIPINGYKSMASKGIGN
jgi:hypothetical protein